MQKKPLKAETVLELTSREDLVNISNMRLDLQLVACSGKEQRRETNIPGLTPAKVVARVDSVTVKAIGKSQ